MDVFEAVCTLLAVRSYLDTSAPDAVVRRIVKAGRPEETARFSRGDRPRPARRCHERNFVRAPSTIGGREPGNKALRPLLGMASLATNLAVDLAIRPALAPARRRPAACPTRESGSEFSRGGRAAARFTAVSSWRRIRCGLNHHHGFQHHQRFDHHHGC